MPPTLRRLIRIALVIALAAVVATRMGSPADEAELHLIGAAHHARRSGDRGLEALRRTGPATVLTTGIGLNLLDAPEIERDPAGPADQIGWITLHETAPIGGGDLVSPTLVALLARLLILAAVIGGLVVVGRLAESIAGDVAGATAEGIWAAHAGLLLAAGRADEPALAAAVAALVLALAADYVTGFSREGALSAATRRRLVLGLAAGLGLALATSFALVPLVVGVVLWLALRRPARRRRGEIPRPGQRARGTLLLVGAIAVLWTVTGFDVGAPVLGLGSHPAVRATARWLGTDAATLGTTAESLTIPAPLVARGLLHAIVDGAAAGPGSALAAGAGVGGLALGALLLAAVPSLLWLRRDRVDVPALLAIGVLVPLITLAFAPERLGPTCALAALPAACVATATALARLARHRRSLAMGLAMTLGVVLAVDHVRAGSAPPPATPADAEITERERWLLDRWLRGAPRRHVHLVIGDAPHLVVRVDGTRETYAASDPRLGEVAARLDGRDVLVVADWLRDALPPDAALPATPTTRLGRLAVFEGASD